MSPVKLEQTPELGAILFCADTVESFQFRKVADHEMHRGDGSHMPATKTNAAVLVGNGLSVAFNPGLNLRSITQEVMRRIRDADGDDVIAAMKELAERALPHGVTSESDFEQLVGVFGSESRSMSNLETLATLTSPRDIGLLDAIRRVAEFADEVRDNGISYVLQVIAERSTAYVDDAADLHQLVGAIAQRFDGNVVIGNLNYDTLLLAALLRVLPPSDLADLGHGWKTVEVVVNDGETRSVPALRKLKSDFPTHGHRFRLLHLHGSLTYWTNEQLGIHAKVPKELLEDGSQWRAVREKTTNIRPVVVLANQRDKIEHVTRYPFNLAYEIFTDGLTGADFWLVVGYSFRDAPVNERLRLAFLARGTKPRVLVVTYGDSPSERDVERAFGWGAEDGDSQSWLTIHRGGANGVQESADWSSFVA